MWHHSVTNRQRHALPVALASIALIGSLLAVACGERETEEQRAAREAVQKRASEVGVEPVPGKRGEAMQYASELEVKAAADAIWREPTVETMESAPVRFAVQLTKDMPMPGYEVVVDGVTAPDAGKVIVAKITEKAPTEPGLTVMDPKNVRFPLGALPAGTYTLRILAREPGGEYRLEQEITLVAR